MSNKAVIDLMWKVVEGDCSLDEYDKVQRLRQESPLWRAAYDGLVVTYREGGHLALMRKEREAAHVADLKPPLSEFADAPIRPHHSAAPVTNSLGIDKGIRVMLLVHCCILGLLTVFGVAMGLRSSAPQEEVPLYYADNSHAAGQDDVQSTWRRY